MRRGSCRPTQACPWRGFAEARALRRRMLRRVKMARRSRRSILAQADDYGGVPQIQKLHPSSPRSPVACHREDPPSLQRSYGRTRWRPWLRRVPQRLDLRSQGYSGGASCPAACRGELHLEQKAYELKRAGHQNGQYDDSHLGLEMVPPR